MLTRRIRLSIGITLAVLFGAATLLSGQLDDAVASSSVAAAGALAPDTLAAEPEPRPDLIKDAQRLPILPPDAIDSETLWLARCIYSETKRPHEQALVAWVVRNRVETGYRGKRTYKESVLDPYQFSAFNRGSSKRRHYTSLDAASRVPGWQTALSIAHFVRHAEASERPFSTKTRHFYSERSMRGGRTPHWARGEQPVDLDEVVHVDERRFRFYDGVW
jgi:hypothetical protein